MNSVKTSSKYPPAEPEALAIAGPSKGPFRNRKSKARPHHHQGFDFTYQSQNAPSTRHLRLHSLNADGHFRKCQTATATPAEPGELLYWFSRVVGLCIDSNPDPHFHAEQAMSPKIPDRMLKNPS
jgi:hypothetical protein